MKAIPQPVASLLLAAILLVSFEFLIPERLVQELNFDEGVNGIKALLLSEGHELYSEIWSDQPPLFTYLLSIWMQGDINELQELRLFVNFFAVLLVLSIFHLSCQSHGLVAAVSASVFLLSSWRFLPYSDSVMVGLPSIALFACALAILRSARMKGSRVLFYLSSLVAAAAISTKLMIVIAFPSIFILLLSSEGWDEQRGAVRLLRFSGGLVVGFVSLLFATAPTAIFHFFDQLLAAHLETRMHPWLGEKFDYILAIQSFDHDLLCLAALGCLLSFRRRRLEYLIPLAWLVSSYAFLVFHSPVWSHHYLYISVPTAWLAGMALGELHDSVRRACRKREIDSWVNVSLACCIVLVSVFAFFSVPQKLEVARAKLRFGGMGLSEDVLSHMRVHKEKTNWVLTDRPIYAVLVGLPVPPRVAVATQKRKAAGMLSLSDYETAIREFAPEQILIARFRTWLLRGLYRTLYNNYTLVYEGDDHYLFLKNGIAGKKDRKSNSSD